MGALWGLLRRSWGGQLWQDPERPHRGWGWAPAPYQPGGSLSSGCAGHPAGRRSAGPLLGPVPKGGGLSCGGPACLRPVIKEEEEGEDAPGTGPEHRGQPDTGSA